MHKRVQILIIISALSSLKDIANGRIRKEQAKFLVDYSNWFISCFRFSGAMLLELRAVLGVALERNTARRSEYHLGFLDNSSNRDGSVRQDRIVPVVLEPRHVSQVFRVPI